MERGLLSSPDLAPHYDDVVWFYLYQDFTHSERDLAAERVALRFGISSWPQHLLVDPADLSILGSTGRSLESFRASLEGVTVGDRAEPGLEELRENDALAARIRAADDADLAQEHLEHPDPVVRMRAAERLAADRPERLVERAEALLGIEHDQLRILVCRTLGERGSPGFARTLEALLADPGRSRNPNVVRIAAARALGACGDARSLGPLAHHAANAGGFNALSLVSVDGIAAIHGRIPESRERAVALLVESFPDAIDPDAEMPAAEREREAKAALRIAAHIHGTLEALTGEERPFPETWDAAARAAVVESWG